MTKIQLDLDDTQLANLREQAVQIVQDMTPEALVRFLLTNQATLTQAPAKPPPAKSTPSAPAASSTGAKKRGRPRKEQKQEPPSAPPQGETVEQQA